MNSGCPQSNHHVSNDNNAINEATIKIIVLVIGLVVKTALKTIIETKEILIPPPQKPKEKVHPNGPLAARIYIKRLLNDNAKQFYKFFKLKKATFLSLVE